MIPPTKRNMVLGRKISIAEFPQGIVHAPVAAILRHHTMPGLMTDTHQSAIIFMPPLILSR